MSTDRKSIAAVALIVICGNQSNNQIIQKKKRRVGTQMLGLHLCEWSVCTTKRTHESSSLYEHTINIGIQIRHFFDEDEERCNYCAEKKFSRRKIPEWRQHTSYGCLSEWRRFLSNGVNWTEHRGMDDYRAVASLFSPEIRSMNPSQPPTTAAYSLSTYITSDLVNPRLLTVGRKETYFPFFPTVKHHNSTCRCLAHHKDTP